MVALATALFFMKSWFFWVLIENHLEFLVFCWFYGKHTQLGISLFVSCKFEREVPISVWLSNPKPLSSKNMPSLAHKSTFYLSVLAPTGPGLFSLFGPEYPGGPEYQPHRGPGISGLSSYLFL